MPERPAELGRPRAQLPFTTLASDEVRSTLWNTLDFKPFATTYVVVDDLGVALDAHIKKAAIVPFVQIGLGLGAWRIEVPKSPGDWLNSWAISELEIAFGVASETPVLLSSDTRLKRYLWTVCHGVDLKPNWLGFEYLDFIERTFSNRIIDSQDHRVFRYLTGQGSL